MADQQWSHGNIHPVQIDKEMKNAYIDYAMSVIVMRALPDVRDGLKPVHSSYFVRDARNRHDAK